MDRQQIDALWFNQQPVPGATFRLNDSVTVIGGEYTGRSGAVISLEKLEPEPLYQVELGDTGSGVRVKESALSAAA